MSKRKGSFRRDTRHKLTKGARQKGKISLSAYFQAFKEGDKVALVAEPAIQKGMYFPMFYGKQGIIKAKRGRCYEVMIKDKHKAKMLLIHPVHLKRMLE